jgi:hypothetical protein
MENIRKVPEATDLFQANSDVHSSLPTTVDKALFIKRVIIIAQDWIMGRGDQHISREDLVGRIIGEVEELKEVILEEKVELDPDIALELADIFYYLLQPEVYASSEIPLNYILEALRSYGLDLDLVYSFVILKYLTRIKLSPYNLEKDHMKSIEREVMILFLKEQGLIS